MSFKGLNLQVSPRKSNHKRIDLVNVPVMSFKGLNLQVSPRKSNHKRIDLVNVTVS